MSRLWLYLESERMKIQTIHLPKKYLGKLEKDVVRIYILDKDNKRRGILYIYEYTDGTIEASILFRP